METNPEKMRKAVFAKRPVLEKIYTESGHLVLAEYVKGWTSPGQCDPGFLKITINLAQKLLGSKMAGQIESQLKARALVSTIDHHGLWGHPTFLNADLIYSLAFSPGEVGVVLATESVSLNNTSSWSGSLVGHLSSGQSWRTSFFPDRQKTLPVWSAPKITQPAWERALSKARFLGESEHERLRELNSIFVSEDILDCENFSQQSSIYSTKLWHTLFPDAPGLVFLPLETIVSEFIVEELKQQNSWLRSIMLTEKSRVLWQKHFTDEKTFLFWQIDSKGKRNSIRSLGYSFTEISKALKNRELYPSSPLCFCILLSCGLTAVGGFTQTTWLTQTKDKFIKFLSEYSSETRILENLQSSQTSNFAEGQLASIGRGSVFLPASAADLWLKKEKYLYQSYRKESARLTVKESIDNSLEEIYRVVVPLKERAK